MSSLSNRNPRFTPAASSLRVRRILAALTPLLVLAALLPTPASATSFDLPAMTVKMTTYVSGDVGRLSQRGNCADLAGAKVLLEMYRIDPGMTSAKAADAAKAMRAAAKSSCRARASANETFLAALTQMSKSSRSGVAGEAVAAVIRQALPADAGRGIATPEGHRFGLTVSIDNLGTLTHSTLDPAEVLRSTFDLAQSNRSFGAAVDAYWATDSRQSVYDSAQTMLANNPELRSARLLTDKIAADGSLTVDETEVKQMLGQQLDKANDASDGAREGAVAVEAAEDANASTETLAQLKARVKTEAEQRDEVIEGAEAVLQFTVMVLKAVDPDVAKEVAAVGKVAIKAAKLFNTFAKAAGSIAVNAAQGNVFGVVVNIVGLALDLAPLFGDPVADQKPPTGEEFVTKQLKSLAADVAAFRKDVDERFDEVDRRLGAITTTLETRFDELRASYERLESDVKAILDSVTTLQTSIARLQANLYTALYETTAWRLWTDANTAIGWRSRSVGGQPMDNGRFLVYAGDFLGWATTGATGWALITHEREFAPDEKVDEELAYPLERNVDYFRRFGPKFGADLGAKTLPNPRDWAVAARAFSQLLIENPEYATPVLNDDLKAIAAQGLVLKESFAKISKTDTESGTGSTLLNGVLANYRRVANAAPEKDKPDSTQAFLRAKEQDFVLALRLDPWGGADQVVKDDDKVVPQVPPLTTCANGTRPLELPNAATIDDLRPNVVHVARRLNVAANPTHVPTDGLCWTSEWEHSHTETVDTQEGYAIEYFGRSIVTVHSKSGTLSPNPTLGKRTYAGEVHRHCSEDYSYDGHGGYHHNGVICSNVNSDNMVPGSWNQGLKSGIEQAETVDTEHVAALRTDVNAQLVDQQKAAYKHVIDALAASEGQKASSRLNGAKALVEGYVTLGMPRTLENDDELHELLLGSDHLPGGQRVKALYEQARDNPPQHNVRADVENTLTTKATRLQEALRRAVAAGSAPDAAETDPLVETTLARLELTRTVVFDTVAPETTVSTGPTGWTKDSTPTFAFASSEAGVRFQCMIDSGSFAACSSPHTTAVLADGLHTLQVRAIDAANNIDATPAVRTFRVDTIAPQTTLSAGPAGWTKDSTPTFAFSSNESGSRLQCKIDSAPFVACTSPHTTAVLADGLHTLQVRAIDAAGNIDATPAVRRFRVDTIAPQTTLSAGPSGSTTDSTPTFEFSSSEAASRFQCKIDSAAFAACTSAHTTAVLADGQHTFQVRAIDAAGNLDPTPVVRTFTITAP